MKSGTRVYLKLFALIKSGSTLIWKQQPGPFPEDFRGGRSRSLVYNPSLIRSEAVLRNDRSLCRDNQRQARGNDRPKCADVGASAEMIDPLCLSSVSFARLSLRPTLVLHVCKWSLSAD
uniref:Uncharacterized protein n=1 Tax=Ananas comosus var. bracteatus TaxID=296719 RepID=A0A6V7NGI1_ANACO|nr:unnamed protein product [Ananas comosus var. bracteatus]